MAGRRPATAARSAALGGAPKVPTLAGKDVERQYATMEFIPPMFSSLNRTISGSAAKRKESIESSVGVASR